MKDLTPLLQQRRAEHRYRQRRRLDGPQQPEQLIDGRPVLAFCSNDYLGLANHPAVIAAFKAGADRYGVGAGAAHLVNGHTRAHDQLEEELAAFTGRDRALLFSTGYMANLGVAQALLCRGDRLLQDRLNHASLIDAARISEARLQRYRHADAHDLARLLAHDPERETLVSTDGVFSMDGDIAPLPALADLCAQAGAWFMVDDAHGLGVLGATGAGTLEHQGLDQARVPILMGTLGKGLGTAGAFVAGSEDLIETLIQAARTYIFTTAMPPAVAEAARTALHLVHAEPERREHLRRLVQRFRAGAAELGLALMDSDTPIQPLLVGDAATAVALSEGLLARGLLVPAIRPPTVPSGTSRLRVTLSAAHTPAHVDLLLETLKRLQPPA
ncbi:8-amino-7-oxononanoate synthase [Ectothiorhodospira lacustris]|uniref:8-amino-7-oxononanoate synthase n=1 Tax=Ectothiorhodospira lacustris TaxID=2899127 RepID=UPI001EE79DAB|nr:8-amino-7-oxononanoate synthase [Ectothiorhodospira lacustris]MCG5499756.1 8-amino-7-oxononanoate synthase [Ectothiorhodospira lacustris]MCG5509787.1 8-amino-7-oxononanoate synthase [Ectothiorhodospira lacustris]MCG5522299.1 8-amino-7-oxononanoate synthase [Ectothiorhodospira lacustris]